MHIKNDINTDFHKDTNNTEKLNEDKEQWLCSDNENNES